MTYLAVNSFVSLEIFYRQRRGWWATNRYSLLNSMKVWSFYPLFGIVSTYYCNAGIMWNLILKKTELNVLLREEEIFQCVSEFHPHPFKCRHYKKQFHVRKFRRWRTFNRSHSVMTGKLRFSADDINRHLSHCIYHNSCQLTVRPSLRTDRRTDRQTNTHSYIFRYISRQIYRFW